VTGLRPQWRGTEIQTYPDRDLVIKALLKAAESAVTTETHPEDIEVTMSFAMERTAPVLMWLHENGHLK